MLDYIFPKRSRILRGHIKSMKNIKDKEIDLRVDTRGVGIYGKPL